MAVSSLSEAQRVWAAVGAAERRGVSAVLAEVVKVIGSAYRRPGAIMMMAADGHMEGTISGGCLEGDLFLNAESVMEGGPALLVDYDLAEDEMWSLGIGCKGQVQVWVRPAPVGADRARLVAMLESGGVIAATLPGGPVHTWVADEPWPELPTSTLRRMQAAWEGAGPSVVDDLYVRAWRPAEHLVISGAGHDAEPVARMAQEVGFRVTVVDPRPEFNDDRRFPGAEHVVVEPSSLSPDRFSDLKGAYWVIMNHHKARDTAALKASVALAPRFIGALGPRRRTDEILASLQLSQDQEAQVHGPLGLDIGADTPYEVALSIVGELMAARKGRTGGILNRREKLHA